MKNVLEYLEQSISRCPEKTAFADLETAVTYNELSGHVRSIGTALAKRVAPGTPVAVFLPKSVRAVEVFFGAVEAGCFYSMLDLKQPESRLQKILETLDTDVIVTSAEHAGYAREAFQKEPLIYEDLVAAEPDETLLGSIRAQHIDTAPLYVNFTSGSTGTPKGVVVCHRSVIDF
ncbi:MAG: AMP-binding protein, partial [Lachnospiraceae bacterium]|nr:AMP-binding protein [Lachnospiraceae bacterium]